MASTEDVKDRIAEYLEEVAELRAALRRGVTGWRRETIAEKIVDFEDMIEDLREMEGGP